MRASVEHEGWGATLLACQDEDGQWAGGAFVPAGFTAKLWEAAGQPWTATAFTFDLLRDLGLPPGCAAARRTVAAVGANARWDHAGEPFWDGEVEECINGRLVTTGSYFGVDMDRVIDRLLDQQMSDGGWNCERENGSVRGSFHTTINVLEGLLAAQTAHEGVQDITAAATPERSSSWNGGSSVGRRPENQPTPTSSRSEAHHAGSTTSYAASTTAAQLHSTTASARPASRGSTGRPPLPLAR